MEEGMAEAEIFGLSHSSGGGNQEEKDHERGKGEIDEDEEARGGDLEEWSLNHIISSMVSGGKEVEEDSSSDKGKDGTVRNERRAENFEVKDEKASADVERGDHKWDEGGVINNFIFNLLHQNEGTEDRKEKDNIQGEEKGIGVKAEEEGGGGGRSVINNFNSNLFHQSEGIGQEEDRDKQRDQEKGNAVKSEEGGGIIDKVASHLHTSLADDVDPATDEASLLIHSIVHD